MSDANEHGDRGPETETAAGRLWPSETYIRQVEKLRAAVGKRIYLVEIEPTDVNVGVRLTDTGYELLALVDFPRPDPVKGLAPHLVLLDDGRGVNLGRIARISVTRPFNPASADVLYGNEALLERFLFRERTLSEAVIAERSRRLLGEILGKRDQVFQSRDCVIERLDPLPS